MNVAIGRRYRLACASAARVSAACASLLVFSALASTSAAAAPGGLSQLGGERGYASLREALGQIFSTAVSPNGRNVYASTGSAVAVFERDQATGALRQLRGKAACISRRKRAKCSSAHGVSSWRDVIVSPDGRNAYVAGARGLTVFARSSKTGVLRQLRGTSGCVAKAGAEGCRSARAIAPAISAPAKIEVSGDGRHAYVASPAGVAIFVRSSKGSLTQPAGAAGCVNADGSEGCATARGVSEPAMIAASADGRNVYVSSAPGGKSATVAAFGRDAGSGVLTQPAGSAGCISEDGSEGCAVGRLSGVMPGEPARHWAGPLATSPDGRNLYVGFTTVEDVADRAAGTTSTFSRDASTGGLTRVAGDVAVEGPGAPIAMAFSPDGRSAYLAVEVFGVLVLIRDSRTGALTRLAGKPGCVDPSRDDDCRSGRGLGFGFGDSVSVSPDGRNVYLTASNAVAVFKRQVR